MQCWRLKQSNKYVCRVFQKGPFIDVSELDDLITNVKFYQNGTVDTMSVSDRSKIRTAKEYALFPKELKINNDAELFRNADYVGLYTEFFRENDKTR